MGELLIVRNEMGDVDIAGISSGEHIFANLVSVDELAKALSRRLGIPIDEAVINAELDDKVDQGLQADAAGIN
jgi:hypothetical protein